MSARRIFSGLALALLAITAAAAEGPCRIAFDIGSSGIRAGADNSSVTARGDIDYLAPLWAGRNLEETVVPTIAALRELPEKAGFASECERVGGGFSAWRLAVAQGADQLAAILARIRSASGVAVLVIPQLKEGAYGYFGAHQQLGEGLRTSHVLDIGGGSLQISGALSAFGETLGQKVWHRHLCQEIRNSESAPCSLQPMTGDELAMARSLLAEKLAGIASALPEAVSMTAISRPVSRGVLPAVRKLVAGSGEGNSFRRADLSSSIERLARLTPEEAAAELGASGHLAWLLSDMLLVEGVLQATGGETLQVAEIDLTNLPGLLADDQAYTWQKRYGCYLERLRSLGIDAYASDPASCQ